MIVPSNTAINKTNKLKNLLLSSINSIVLIIIIVLTLIFFSIRSNDFLSLSNSITILGSISTIGIVCIGQTLLLISGDFDLSVGSIAALAGVILAKILELYEVVDIGRSFLIILLVIIVGGIISLLTGVIITKIGVNALITTIAVLSIVYGISLIITKSNYITIVSPFFTKLGGGVIGNIIPISTVILIILYIGFYILLKKTVFGRYIYAIGNNKTAAKYAGINVSKIRILLFMISGITTSIGGIILASKLTNAQAIFAQNYNLMSITACVIGGCVLTGGRGGMVGSLLGASFLVILRNGLSMIGLSQYIQDLVTGILLIIAIYISESSSGR